MGEKMTPCAECGMPCEAGEYHPYVACLMFKGCHNSATVRANLTQPAQAVDVWTGEIECCDAKGFWLVLAAGCPFVPGQKVTITAARPNANGKEGS